MRRLALWTALAVAVLAGTAPARSGSAVDPERRLLVLLRMPPPHFHAGGDYGGGYGGGQGRSSLRRMAARIARAHGLTLVTDWPMPLLGLDCFVMSAPGDRSPAALTAELSRDPDVAWSEPMNHFVARGGAATPNDPLFRVQPAARKWRLAELHEISTGRGIRVAVVDSMIDRTQPDLIGQVQLSENFVLDRTAVAEQHGTAVAGVIAALADNGVGITGIAPDARQMALRACWQTAAPPDGGANTVCDSLSLAKALHFAITHDAQVINLSLSGPQDPLLGRLLDIALARGVTVVGAFDPDLPGGGFPASHPGVVAVADDSEAAAGVVGAPGRDVPATQPGGRWSLVNGSSYAAAHVSGLFALLRARNPQARSAAALVRVRGSSAIDACATLMQAAGPCDCGCARRAGGVASTARP
jgi:subtilisin family serine protease